MSTAGAGGVASSGAVSEAVSKVEAELNAFWSQAEDESGAHKARATTMNFVAVAAPAEADALRAGIEELAGTRAGRVFMLTVDGRLAPWELAHDVGAVCRKEGDVAVCYDRVELSFGAMAAGRAGSVLSTLALSEVPMILEIGRGAPGVIVDPLVKIADRVVVDSAHTAVGRIAEIARKARAPIADRAFVRAFSWRELVARFFDEATEAARSIRKVTIERASDGKHDPAALFLGWLASRLGWRFESPAKAVDAKGEPVEIQVGPPRVEGVAVGEIAGVRIAAMLGGEPLDLVCERAGGERAVRWSMSGARTAHHEHPLGFRDEGWVLLKAIDSTESDGAYREAVLAAADWGGR